MDVLLPRVFQVLLHTLLLLYHLFDDEGLSADTREGAGVEAGYRLRRRFLRSGAHRDPDLPRTVPRTLVHGGESTLGKLNACDHADWLGRRSFGHSPSF